MSSRRTCALLALVVAMLALATTPSIRASAGDRREPVMSADSASTVQAVRRDGTVPRDEASDRAGSDRTIRSGLALFAVLAAVLCVTAGGRHAPAGARRARRAAGSRWSPIASRAPPSFRIA